MKKRFAALLAVLCLFGQAALAAGYRVETVKETDVFVQDGVKLAEFVATFPQLAGLSDAQAMDRVNRSIRDHIVLESHYEELKEIAKSDYETGGRDFSNYYYSVYAEAEAKKASARMLSVLFSFSYFAGGAHPDNWRTAVMYDLMAGAPVTVGELVGDVDAFHTLVADVILARIQKENLAKTHGYFEGYEDTVRAWPLSQSLFTDEGLLVFFNPYDIAPYASGPHTFTVPYAAFDNLLSDLGKALLAAK